MLALEAAGGLEVDHVFVLGLRAGLAGSRSLDSRGGPGRTAARAAAGRRRSWSRCALRQRLYVAVSRARGACRAGLPGRRGARRRARAAAAVEVGARGARRRLARAHRGAVRSGRDAPVDLPAAARRADGRDDARRRAPRRAAARHRPRRLPRGRPLPGAAEAGGADRPTRRTAGRRRAARHQRPDRAGGHGRSA